MAAARSRPNPVEEYQNDHEKSIISIVTKFLHIRKRWTANKQKAALIERGWIGTELLEQQRELT